jgi:hypothetical protein
MRLFSFRAFRENFNEDDEKGGHMPRLLLRELYKNFSAYFHSAPSPTALIFIMRLLWQRLFAFRVFSNSVYKKKTRKEMASYKIPMIDKDLYFKKLKQNHT